MRAYGAASYFIFDIKFNQKKGLKQIVENEEPCFFLPRMHCFNSFDMLIAHATTLADGREN